MSLGRSGTPCSIVSSDSDIRFTRKLSNQYRPCCCVTAFLLSFLLLTTLALYAAYKYQEGGGGTDVKVFLGVLTISSGEVFRPELAEPSSELFRLKAREYREGLNLWLKRSELKPAFITSDILAFNGEDNSPVVVHFSARFYQRRFHVSAEDVVRVLSRETYYFGNKTVDPDSVYIHEEVLGDPDRRIKMRQEDLVTPAPYQPPARVCQAMELSYCSAALHSNTTSYPNLVGHLNIEEVLDHVITFRELVDSECYRLTYDFICNVLQPPCSSQLILPCRSFCKEFWNGCGQRIPVELQKALNCSNLPEYSAEHPSCLPKPGCRGELESTLVCDGTADCADLSDETSCFYCTGESLLCTRDRACIHPDQRCDGHPDCSDASDERACLRLDPELYHESAPSRSVQAKHYHASGDVIFLEKGEKGKLCADNVNTTLLPDEREETLNTVASSLCRTLSFKKVKEVKIVEDKEDVSRYAVMEDPKASEISFIPSKCHNKQILSIHCSDPECGISTVSNRKGLDGLSKMAAVGDWPWHVALFQSGTHLCDGTLIDMEWVATTASCFQGQDKAEWIVRGGSTRLASTSPWQQERFIVGMVMSPVEGSTVALLRLNKPFASSDFVRPTCLPSPTFNFTYCNTLGWTSQRTMLQRVEVRLSDMEQCANISITTVNSICTDSHYNNQDCMEEEYAGAPMLCLEEDKWVLAGVSNWRIACSKVGDRRPRLYDSIMSNIDWIKTVLKEKQ